MAKKTLNKKITKKRPQPAPARQKIGPREFLEKLIFFTQRALMNTAGKPDKGMAAQLARLQAELAALK